MNHVEAAQEEVKADVTPMIDTVFLLIVFFVCLDFRCLEAKLPAYLPRDRGGGPPMTVPQEQLSVQIHELTPGRREPRVVGRSGSDPATHGIGTCYVDVAQTIDVVKAAGFDELFFGGGAR